MAPYSLVFLLNVPLAGALLSSHAATPRTVMPSTVSSATATVAMPTMVAMPTKERTGTNVGSQRRRAERPDEVGGSAFEWGLDPDASREDGDDFHILLLNATFEKPRMTVAYAAGALCLVLGMAERDAHEHSSFAMQQGFSCLGSWRRDECLQYCEQLSGRDVVVRAVPGVRGKQAWQGSPANTSPESLPASR
mmetsp:Transcript_24524/g.73607  ORF Transcript_24524/g.73607 Transcript_24524/m.73607 type:complete len:193 (+) Transcript_24524:132-710(+)